MKDATMIRASTTLSRRHLQELRSELERARDRFDPHDARHQVCVDALQRMDEGVYGACESCGRQIPLARLSVVPETRYCVACGPRR